MEDVTAQAQITQAFGQQAAKAIGDYATGKLNALNAQIDQETDPIKRAALKDEASKWEDNGTYRMLLHTATGALTGGLAGAAGAAGSSLAMNAIAEQIDKTDLPEVLKQGLAQIAAGAIGSAAGGNAGMAAAVNVEANNRQLHQDEKTWIKTNAKRYASTQGISVEQALQELTAQANRQVQFGSPGEWDQSASAFLNQAGRGLLPADGNSGPGYMFYATPDQKANMDMYAQFGHTNTPSGQDLAAAASRDQNIRQNVSNATLAAAGAAGVIAGAGPLAAISGTPIFSTNGALGSVMWASPLGTGTISAGINAGAQYYQNGTINPIDVSTSFLTGAAGSYGKLFWNIGVNTVAGGAGAAANNYFNGTDNSVVGNALASGVFSSVGYGLGKAGANLFTSAVKPTINTTNWAGTGTWSGGGWNLFRPNTTPVITGGFIGSTGQSAIESVKNKNISGDKN
ncbi:ribosomal protein L12E/L44/L45/RPP1/RPP2 [Herbaspirillum sp. Sphag1AN]|uniref:hypothetical protein n=1 Tax=unclassified Herbaspirillum TaxID=2624150 RepID=UPI0016167C42|nr:MULTISPECIES: hypothetical protein [unclassified Herbaspirillum]MBB3214936.1 ribosomal protein L12E/L44/L45/RPP1/RPP2 [Herbaspirillum sp. Sphag1AN]MBB3248133.1 ribosomal protein L12E/L44/L45/RPP1/RPP2 [Herbaspirillum sp. Sphag64]